MFNSKEISSFIIIALILALTISFFASINAFLNALLIIFLVLLINVLAKKISSYYFDSEIEIGLWEVRRWGYKKHHRLKKAVPAGIFLPLIVSVFSVGNLLWLACLVFDVKPKTYRAAKRHGLYSFSEMTESHIGYIAAIGVAANLLFAILGYLLGYGEFARLNIYLAFFNMIPLSSLDGNKIFFGSIVLWSFLAALVLVGLGYAFFIV